MKKNQLINGETKIYGILGNPVSHSLSPLLHNTAFSFSKFNGVYIPLPIEKPSLSTKTALINMGVSGLSVTIPHKKWAAKIADKRDASSEYCQAANTIKIKNGLCYVYNTDGAGALNTLERKLKNLNNKCYLILGYGGSARAIAHSLILKSKKRKILIAGRNPKKKQAFIKLLRNKHPQQSSLIHNVEFSDISPHDVDVIINTTPLGMHGKKQCLPLPGKLIHEKHWVFDIVYTPRQTMLLKYAQSKKAKCIPGYLMLLHQAALQFEIFTNKKAPLKLMEKTLLQALK